MNLKGVTLHRRIHRSIPIAACFVLALLTPGTAAPPAGAAAERMPALYKNCTNLNKKYPHGLGRAGAVDRTSGEPVTTFKRSTRLYKLAMSYNRGLDRDKDGVAWEKK